jgi:hypothetical protein
MADFKVIDEAEFGRKARPSGVPRAVAARLDRRAGRVVVSLDNGIAFAFDPARIKGLEAAVLDDLADVAVEGAGGVIRFPKLDADYTVSHLVEAFIGPTDWSRREARAQASRANGKRGGRPRRLTTAAQ